MVGPVLPRLLHRNAGSPMRAFPFPAFIGIVMLMGLVTKNAILLIDFANQARAGGMSRTDALLEAARIRLRPILMTTLAMVFGMLPLALGVGEGSEQRAPLAHAVIGGVIASTLLTLIVVPVIYALLDSLSSRTTGKTSESPAPAHQDVISEAPADIIGKING